MDNTVNLQSEEGFTHNDGIQVVAFRLGKEEYAVDILHVQEIVRLLSITRVPRSAKHIEGVVNLRGNIVPIINLHKRFSIESAGEEEDKRIVVFQYDDLKAGIIVDEVSEVLALNNNAIEETDKVYSSMSSDFIKGIARVDDRLFLLLDLQKIIE
ncbi:chemotaxis protein CheW [Syntrophomonas wolfei]|uniref:CheW protein n=1 Tax=Syntrophomonas wolfei subsp. wolfei (strain DSM 2245B / Goettingen) TaxID=335541 RepID=Q0AYL1_SYNWW|nr:chemotaxis protein CheW [Syntrophomonas wolfei]ABI68193.1 CheW protein [Syntrophomonas wolfei subsp. wolfei str. Goettingen G311]